MAATNPNGSSRALTALTTAALALPGLSPDTQAGTPAERQWDVGFFYYDEGEGRMTVESLQQSLTLPLGERFDLTLNAVRDSISGASPIYNLPEIRC